MKCEYCNNTGWYPKKVIKGFHASGNFKVFYERILVCDRDECWKMYKQERDEDNTVIYS